jgi:Flp pilus assembly CpaE family ATPase
MVYCLILVGMVYGIIALIAFSYEPQSRIMTSKVSLERLNQ